MGKVTIPKGNQLHGKDEHVKAVEIILSGDIMITDHADVTINARQGTVLASCLAPGAAYGYDYIAAEDTTLFVYDYASEGELVAALQASPTILPVMASANHILLRNLQKTLAALYESAYALYTKTKNNYEDYRVVCATLMTPPTQFVSVEFLLPPEKPTMVDSWRADLCTGFYTHDAVLRKEVYAHDTHFCVGAIMQAASIMRTIREEIDVLRQYFRDTKVRTEDFVQEYFTQKSKVDHATRQEAIEAGSSRLPTIENALDTILAYAGVGADLAETFRRNIQKFMDAPNQREKSDEMRQLRQEIAEGFYAVYEAAFFKSREGGAVPAEVKMMFLFGFVDENLAGKANTATLYKHALLWEDDPTGCVLTAYDWLVKVYTGEVMPSKSELDLDWPEFLKEQVRTAEYTQAKADELIDDMKARVHFELTNMLATANRMTHGSLYSFIPAFSASVVTRSLDTTFANPKKVRELIDRVRDVDFSCFYRPAFVSYPELKINRFDYNVEVLPYVILMPNFGTRGALWQEIDGRKRATPGRMVLSAFHAAELEDTVIQMCAQFRWEMCRRIQGVHYSDITDPSLTAEYNNYLQFYKKNRVLSGEQKETLKQVLVQKRNNYKNVFVADYEKYIKNEAVNMFRLNKVARDILFRYCTFSKKYRTALSMNAQYQPLIEKWQVRQAAKKHSFDVFMRSILTMTDEFPAEVMMEAEFMKM